MDYSKYSTIANKLKRMYVCMYIYITSYIIDVQLYYDNFGIYIYNIIYIYTYCFIDDAIYTNTNQLVVTP